MKTEIPKGFEKIAKFMSGETKKIEKELLKKYKVEDYPKIPKLKELKGEAAAVAYPIQGLLKYHGMPDWNARTAFMPSISLNNDAAKTITIVKFDSSFSEDSAVINGKKAEGRDLERVQQTINLIRKLTGASTKAQVISKNIIKATKTGKGLGTSASASAALALATIHAALGEKFSSNLRFVTTISRLLAGSGCRSASGGISIWLSYPGISHEDSYSIRLDDKDQFEDIALITVPIDSRIGLKTELAHKDAPNSPLYQSWMQLRPAHLREMIKAIQDKDWKTIGQLGELDTMMLHGITMSGNRENKVIGWEPETITLMRVANDLREKGIPVYFSIDTGPTPVYITPKENAEKVAEHLRSVGFDDLVIGKIAGPAKIIPLEQAKKEIGV